MAADYQLSVQILGAKELKDAIASVSGIALQAIKDALDKTAIDLEYKARGKAPHKTGALWTSIHTEPAQVTADNVEAKVGTTKNIKYARAQEYGTRGMTIHSHSRSGKPFTYIGNIPPKYYMRDAREEIKPEMTENMSAAAQKIVRHLATKG